MAVVQNLKPIKDPNDPNDPNAPADASAPKPIQLGGAPAPESSAAAPTVKSAPTSSGRFTNLQSYIDANKGFNQQGGGLAGKIYSNLSRKAGNIDQELGKQHQAFNTQSEAGRTTYDPNFVNQALADPSQFVESQDNLSAFQKMANAAYGGPTGLSGGQQLLEQAQQFQGTANLAGTEHGRFALLNKLYHTPTYGHGQQSLDQLLLQGDPEQLQKLQEVNPLSAGLSTNIKAGVDSAKTAAEGYTTEAEKTSSDTLAALLKTINVFGTEASTAAKQADEQRSTTTQQAIQRALRGEISQADLTKLGLTLEDLTFLNPDQLATIFKQGTTTATAQNVLTPKKQAEIQALSKLAGGNITGEGGKVLESFAGNTAAGSFAKEDPYSVDKKTLQGLQQQNKSNLNKIFEDLTQGNQYVKQAASLLKDPRKGLNPVIKRSSGAYLIKDANSMINSPGEISKNPMEAVVQFQNMANIFDQVAQNVEPEFRPYYISRKNDMLNALEIVQGEIERHGGKRKYKVV